MSRLLVLCLVCTCLFLASVPTKADTIKFNFDGIGILDFDRPRATSIKFQAVGLYDSALGLFRYMSDGAIDLTIINNGSAPNKGQFRISFGGGDRIIGIFTGTVFPPNANGILRFVLSYTITGGTGVFRGATGGGSEEIRQDFTSSLYLSKGGFTITVPGGATPIPEPAALLLFGTGLAGVAARLKRRKSRKD